MSVSTGDVVAQLFTTTNPATGAAADADVLPTGVLWVDGVADAAVVTIADAAGTGKYTFSVTMPSLTVAKRVQVIVDATIAGLACAGVVWEDQAAPAVNVTLWKGETPSDLNDTGEVVVDVYSWLGQGVPQMVDANKLPASIEELSGLTELTGFPQYRRFTAEALEEGAGPVGDAVLDEVVEGTYTLRQIVRLLAAALAGVSGGGGTTGITFTGLDGTTTRITATVDASGNRTAMTLNGD